VTGIARKDADQFYVPAVLVIYLLLSHLDKAL
jgi:hypothetical protein